MSQPSDQIYLTEKSVLAIKRILKENNAEGKAIRLFLSEGGCSGWKYGMGIDDPAPDDIVLDTNDLQILIDPASYPYLKGLTVHYDDGFSGRGFSFENPNSPKSCGCGKSFRHSH